MLSTNLLKKIATVLTVCSFFIPLVVLPSSFIFPFIVPKIILFRIVTLLLLGIYLLLLFADKDTYRIRLTAIHAAIFVFFLSVLISTFTGVDWYRSFWDGHERMLGLFTIAHYCLYAIVLSAIFRTREDWNRLFRYFILAGSIVMIVGFWQRFVDPEALLNRGSKRVHGTLGNSIYQSGYGIFLFFLSAILYLQERTKGWKYLWAATGFLAFLNIFLGGTRGAVIGVFVGLLVVGSGYAFVYRTNKQVRISSIAVIVLLLLSLIGAVQFRDTSFVKSIPAVGRLVSTDIASFSSNTRVMAWGIAIDAWKEKPLFGWGPNNYYYAFNEYYKPAFLSYGYAETWFDNAHSSVFNTLTVQGIVGLLAYLALFGVPIVFLIRRRNQDHTNDHVVILSIGFLVAHFVATFFVFENPTSYLYFFFFLAFIAHYLSQGLQHSTAKQSVSYGLAGTVCAVIALLIFSTNINPARANMQTLDAIRDFNVAPDVMFGLLESGPSAPSPHIDDIRNDLIRTMANSYVPLSKTPLPKESLDTAFHNMQHMIQQNKALHPLDIRNHLLEVQLYQARTAAGHMTVPIMAQTLVPSLEEALQYSPKRQQISFVLSAILGVVGEQDRAEALLIAARDSNRQIGEAWWRLLVLYDQTNQAEKMQTLLKEIDTAGEEIQFNTQTAQQIEQLKQQLQHTKTNEVIEE